METRKSAHKSEDVRARLANTPLHLAVFNNDIDMVESLIQSGVSVDTKNAAGQTAFELACELGHYDCAEKFESILQYYVDTSDGKYGRLFLYAITLRTKLELAKKLYAAGASTAAVTLNMRHTALHQAVECSNDDGVKFLLSIGASLSARNSYNHTPISLAAANKSWSIAKIMIEAIDKAKLSEEDLRRLRLQDALTRAIRDHQLSMVELLLEHGASCQVEEETFANVALWSALVPNKDCRDQKKLSSEIIILLLKHGADPDTRNDRGENMHELALWSGNTHAADILSPYVTGSTPEMRAELVTEIEQTFQDMLSPKLDADAVVMNLVKYYRMTYDLLMLDIKALMAKRNRLNLDREKHQDEIKVLDSQILTLQRMRNYPETAIQLDSNFTKTTIGIHAADHLKHLEQIEQYNVRIKEYLDNLEHVIDTTTWKIKSFLDVFTNKWHDGMPRHIRQIKDELKRLNNESSSLEVLNVYYMVIGILGDVPHNGYRHPDTAAFYQQQKQKIQHLRFLPGVESLASSRLRYNNN